MKPRTLAIPLDRVIPPAKPLRENINPDHIAELSDSLERLGQLVPILVRRQGEQYQILDGHRRFLAARRLEWPTIQGSEYTGGKDQDLLLMVAANTARADLTPWEEAQAVHDLVMVHQHDVDQVARAMGRTRTWVDRRLELYTWPPDVRQPIHDGTLSLAAGAELAQVTEEHHRRWLVGEATKNGCTAITARMWRQEWESRQQPPLGPMAENPHTALHLPPPHTGITCSSCGTLTPLQHIRTLHVCQQCLEPKENAT